MSAYLTDGFSTIFSLSGAPSILLKEKTVTPPGVDGGGENDTTTMRNLVWRTKQPKRLKTLTEVSASCAYNPAVYTDIVAQVNVNQLITITFADGSTITFWGWLNQFQPGAAQEGEQPVADVTIICSNQNNSNVEVAPVIA